MIAAIVDASINHARTVLTTFLLLVVAGVYAYINIPKESSPDIDIPQIYISMHLEGVSPDDSERLLIRPMEQELNTIEGIKEIKATAYQGGGFVLLEFQAGFNKDKALDDVQKAVDQVRAELPTEVEEPQVTEVNFSLFPVLVVTLSGDLPERSLQKIADQLQTKIESIPAVLEAAVAGKREELVEIVVKPELLESYGLVGTDILNYFNLSNRLVAAGNLDTGAGRFAVEVPGLFESIYDVMSMPLKTRGDSAIVVGDIAEIRRTFKDPENFARLNGQRAVAVEVVKRSGENIIETIEAVREVVENEKALWPQNIHVAYTLDESETIRTMLLDLENNMISAILLVLIVTIWYIGVRASVLVGVAIPGSFLAGILFLYLTGLTVNVVVLFSLIFSAGMVVDSATIVIEYADRKMSEGLDKKAAYAEAAKRMAWPIISSTATILAAFAPLLFWPGIVGEFMKYMPLTLIAVLLSSLIFALIFVPTIGAMMGKPAKEDPELKRMVMASENGDLNDLRGLTGWYVRVLERCLRRPGLVVTACVIMLIGIQILYGFIGKGVEFFPDIEPDFATVLVHARGNLSIHEKDKLVREVEQRILGVDGIETVYTRAGGSAQRGADLAADVIGQLQLQFKDWDMRRPADEILTEIRTRTADIAGIMVETQKQEGGPPGGKAVQIQLASRFPEKLEPMTETILGALNEIGDFRDIEDTRPLPGIDWQINIDRAQAAKFGLDTTTIGYYVRMVTNGLEVAEYRPDDSDDEIDIVIRHDFDQRTLQQLDRIRIETAAGGAVPISAFAERLPKPAVGVINRSDQRRIITIKADLPPGMNINAKVEAIKNWIAAHADQIDPDIDITFKGEDEDQRESQEFLSKAFIVALFIIAIIMVTQFNSFFSALLILSAVIMSTIGVMLGLIIMGQPFGIIMSGIGVISLAGIIVANNIVLIDTFDHIRREYGGRMSVKEMILRTGAQRLRPILLTVLTTVIGLLPMVFQTNIDFVSREVNVGAPSTQWWVQLSTAVAFGLSFSTVLTLIVTPSALMLRENLKNRFGGMPWKKF